MGTGTTFPNLFSYSYYKQNRLKSGTSIGIIMSEVLIHDLIGNNKTLNRGVAGGTYNFNGTNKLSLSIPMIQVEQS